MVKISFFSKKNQFIFLKNKHTFIDYLHILYKELMHMNLFELLLVILDLVNFSIE